MSAYRDSLSPEQRPRYDQAMDAVAELVVRARARRDSLPADEAAREAYVPGGPSVQEIEALILRHRAEARADRESEVTSDGSGRQAVVEQA